MTNASKRRHKTLIRYTALNLTAFSSGAGCWQEPPIIPCNFTTLHHIFCCHVFWLILCLYSEKLLEFPFTVSLVERLTQHSYHHYSVKDRNLSLILTERFYSSEQNHKSSRAVVTSKALTVKMSVKILIHLFWGQSWRGEIFPIISTPAYFDSPLLEILTWLFGQVWTLCTVTEVVFRSVQYTSFPLCWH